ncbi:MAG: hypothetical protein ACLPV8_29950, partial [Steroidobacteraceae bacterium]
MPKEAEQDGKNENDGSGNIRGTAVVAGLAANNADDERKSGGGQNHAAGINANAANPFLEVVALSPEYK